MTAVSEITGSDYPALHTWLWDPTPQVLESPRLHRLSSWLVFLLLLSSVFSLTLAECLISESAFPTTGGFLFLDLFQTFLLYLLLFAAYAGIIYRILHLFSPEVKVATWMRASVLAQIPWHFTLPAALLCRSMGMGGLLLYGFIKALLTLAVLRRWVWGIQRLYQWPVWKAMATLVAPFALTLLAMVILAVLLGAVLVIVLAGSL